MSRWQQTYLSTTGFLIIISANFITSSSYVAENNIIWHDFGSNLETKKGLIKGIKMVNCLQSRHVLVNSNALILVPLCGNHNVSLVEDEYFYFSQIKTAQFRSPIQQLARSTNKNVIVQLRATRN
jgi:hypothetical protein